ncbi:MAG: DUF6442 family protein [Clostridiaceae bacterium]|nr:DUF6442 family protein [Clostridiaceae bacterium]
MNKEEILEKSRQSTIDEGIEHAENEGRKTGYIIFTIVYAFIITFNLFFGESDTFHALSSLFSIFIATEAFQKYRFIKNKIYLISAIAAGMTSIISLINYILTTLR